MVQVMVPASASSVSMPNHPDVERASNCSHVVTSELASPPIVYLVSCCLHPDELDESGLRLQGKKSLDCFQPFSSVEDTGEVSCDEFEGNSEGHRGGLVQLGLTSLGKVHQRVNSDGVMKSEGRASVDMK